MCMGMVHEEMEEREEEERVGEKEEERWKCKCCRNQRACAPLLHHILQTVHLRNAFCSLQQFSCFDALLLLAPSSTPSSNPILHLMFLLILQDALSQVPKHSLFIVPLTFSTVRGRHKRGA